MKGGLHNLSSAKQMLAHHSSVMGEVPTPNDFRNIFLTNLQNVGNYPNNFRKVAIINGSYKLAPNEHLQESGEMLYIQIKRAGLLGLVKGLLGDRLRIVLNAAPRYGTNTTSDFWLFSPLFNLALWHGPRERNYAQPTPGNYSYDSCPGSYFPDPVGEKTDAWMNIGESLLYLFAGNKSTFRHNIIPTFMPTTSAMDLQGEPFTLEYDFTDKNIVCMGKTPFNRVYAPEKNEYHVEITSQNAEWFRSEIEGDNIKEQPGGIGNFVISGNDIICSDLTYAVNSLPTGASIKWTASGAISINGADNTPSVSVRVSDLGSANGYLSAQISSPCGVSNTPVKTITNSAKSWDAQILLAGASAFSVYDPITVYVDKPCPGATHYSWGVSGFATVDDGYVPGAPSSATVTLWDYENYVLTCDAYTDCGVKSVALYIPLAYNYENYSLSSYPNPADEELVIAYSAESEKKSDPIDGVESAKVKGKYFEAILFDEKGKEWFKGNNGGHLGTLKINTKSFPEGKYFLHLKNEKNLTKKQIIIKH